MELIQKSINTFTRSQYLLRLRENKLGQYNYNKYYPVQRQQIVERRIWTITNIHQQQVQKKINTTDFLQQITEEVQLYTHALFINDIKPPVRKTGLAKHHTKILKGKNLERISLLLYTCLFQKYHPQNRHKKPVKV